MQASQLKEAFNSFTGKNILVIGDVMVDAYLWGKVERISPEAPVPILNCQKRENRLGGAANVALNVQALGANPILCAAIGNDDKGAILMHLLEKKKMETGGMLKSEKRKTTAKTRLISQTYHLLRVDDEITTALDNETEQLFIEHVLTILSERIIDAIIFEDYDKGVITPLVIEKIVEHANQKNIPTLVDPKKRNFLHYNHVTLFKPNFKELVEGLKIDIDKGNFEKINKAAGQLQSLMNVKYILTTLSELGVFVKNETTFRTIPAVVRDIADVSGAGDTVISVASLCLSCRISIFDIAAIANLAGGLVCEKVGVVPIDKNLLLNESIRFFEQLPVR